MLQIKTTDNHGQQWQRVSKAKARKSFASGEYVTFCPAKLMPFGGWNPSSTRAEGENLEGAEGFEYYCENFSWYNCTNETGNYIAFYIKVN